MMLCIPKIGDCSKTLKDFVAINFSEFVNSTREKLYFKLSDKQNLAKVHESHYISL